MNLTIDRRTVIAGAAGLAGSAAIGAEPAAPQAPMRVGPFEVAIDPRYQTIASLAPAGADRYDFTPTAHIRAHRGEDGYHALGDIELRLRTVGGEWRDYATAFHRLPVTQLPLDTGDLAAADLAPCFPRDMPLAIVRRWQRRGDDLLLSFFITNRNAVPVELGGVGLPMVFDNIFTGRTLEQVHDQASFAEPYIGQDGGYVQVTRIDGTGPVLIVLPEPGTPLEAWKPIPANDAKLPAVLLADRTPRSVTFEGFYCWMAATAAFASREWRGAEQWNMATSIALAPGETRRIGLRFILAATIRTVEDRLAAAGRPVVVGLPGYIVAPDADCALFVRAAAPLKGVEVSPPGALIFGPAEKVGRWQRFNVAAANHWGRARATLIHADGTRQTVQYFVTKPAAEAVTDLGHHSFTEQWFDSPGDKFGRSPSVLGYDRAEAKPVTSDRRVYIAGLSDEAGAGPWLAAIMKQLDNPDPEQVARFERFHARVVEGHLQVEKGPQLLGVRKSVFYYDPADAADYDPEVDWSRWPSWTKDAAYAVDRSFNYPHVVAAQWVLYRLARNHVGLVKVRDWRWYLERAADTTLAMCHFAAHQTQFGQMEGDVFLALLLDLRREKLAERADAVEAAMRARAAHWSRERFPYGSEMLWDSTGQEEVFAWMRHFGDHAKAAVTREAILAYDFTLPHWGYNGSARRYWDFRIAAKLQREERQLHHYGSSINALPLLAAYRDDPNDFHLLRVGYAGQQGALTNINRNGFAGAAFHAWPDVLRFDDFSGDYGPSFFGHAFGAASYLVRHPEFGWFAFGGRLQRDESAVAIAPADSARSRCFIAPLGLWITLDAGKLARVVVDDSRVTLHFAPATDHTAAARLRLETPGKPQAHWRPTHRFQREREAWVIALRETDRAVPLTRA